MVFFNVVREYSSSQKKKMKFIEMKLLSEYGFSFLQQGDLIWLIYNDKGDFLGVYGNIFEY